MAWILLEGLDRSGKSTVAEMYKKQGYEVVHMDAPDKKYSEPGYEGPSYLEDIVHMYTLYNGKNVLFDRTIYGEKIWPEIFNRMPLLNSQDLEYLRRLEYNNEAVRYIMHDEDFDAHWQRCVDSKERINRIQFAQAAVLYDKLAQEHSFEKKQLGDFDTEDAKALSKDESDATPDKNTSSVGDIRQDLNKSRSTRHSGVSGERTLEEKLERANAIRSLLGSPLVKKKGEIFKGLEKDIKGFLEQELEEIFSESKKDIFTQEEVHILKIYAQRIKETLG